MPLERTVVPSLPLHERLSAEIVEFDASPWGGGAARRRGDVYLDYFAVQWSTELAGTSGAPIGCSSGQSFWEFFCLLLVLLVWGESCPGRTLQIQGDNTSALQQALKKKGRGSMLSVSRELAWRQARFSWQFSVAHLPSEHNAVADALSRQWGEEWKAFPAELVGKPQLEVPGLSTIWAADADP